MSTPSISEIKSRANIRDVWAALGGGELRHNRGIAFWREGRGYNVAINAGRNTWHDFVSGEGGDVIELVKVVRGYDFRTALAWLADFVGVSLAHERKPLVRTNNPDETAWTIDLRSARYWAIAARLLAEGELERVPFWHDDWRELRAFVAAIRRGDCSLVEEYRDWRRREPELTSAMVHAGRNSDVRVQDRVAAWLMKEIFNAEGT